MIFLGTVDRSREHIEIEYGVDAEECGPGCMIWTSVALVAPYPPDSVVIQYSLSPDQWGKEDDYMLEAVQKEIDHYLVDLGGEPTPWLRAIHRALGVEVDEDDEDGRVEWSWYPDNWWEWIDNSSWLPMYYWTTPH